MNKRLRCPPTLLIAMPLVTILALLSLGCPGEAAVEVSGQVVSKEDGKSAAGAKVESFWVSNEGWSHLQGDIIGTLDADGTCEVALENLGVYLFRVSTLAGAGRSHLAEVDANSTTVTQRRDAAR